MGEPEDYSTYDSFPDEPAWPDEPPPEEPSEWQPEPAPALAQRVGRALAGDRGALPRDALAELRREVDQAYPYDPRLHIHMQVDLDKLRCVSDRHLAAQLLDFYRALYPHWESETFKAERAREARQKIAKEVARLENIAEAAFAGKFGDAAKQLAVMILIDDSRLPKQSRTDEPSLRAFELELRKLRRRAA